MVPNPERAEILKGAGAFGDRNATLPACCAVFAARSGRGGAAGGKAAGGRATVP
ncbi:hypothetical protein BLTE_02730 [Blastochloris tepida]|uniref:Uncharacterized protein n=1 Tax=Blastochloris tepida TaxID=2233851 RepID=A0A348FWA5_9HYPH|nr:hypothetical protein BLTE_02730 [Blastochloris tepida]